MPILTDLLPAGRYRVLRQIGKGGMSEVFLAEDLILHRRWAVKAAGRGEPAGDRKADRLLAEAELLSGLDHPGIPRVVEQYTSGQAVLLVMDFAGGLTLEEYIRQEGVPSERQVWIWARELCDILSYLHSQDPPVIYRDMKPSNIIYRPFGHLKLIDFGIAIQTPAGAGGCAASAGTGGYAAPAGTRGYAPPEQYLEGCADVRADLYALGKTLFFLLTGMDPRSPAYHGQRAGMVRKGCSKEMEQIIERCTAADPRRRSRSADDLMKDLLRPGSKAAKNRVKKHLKRMGYAAVICLVAAGLTGFVFRRAISEFTAEETYKMRVRVSRTCTADEREASYLEAIALDPAQKTAYIRLLELYESTEQFGDAESAVLTEQLDKGRYFLGADPESLGEIYYRIGKLYFFRFTGGDGSARERIFRAWPYFEEWNQLTDPDEEDCFYELCRFYRQYAAGLAGEPEPDAAAYQTFLKAVSGITDQFRTYQGIDAVSAELSGYRELAGFLYSWRFALYEAGADCREVCERIKEIQSRAMEIPAARESSVREKKQLIADCGRYLEQIRLTWESVGEPV